MFPYILYKSSSHGIELKSTRVLAEIMYFKKIRIYMDTLLRIILQGMNLESA
jgi:hypothetical protein